MMIDVVRDLAREKSRARSRDRRAGRFPDMKELADQGIRSRP
jgi:hypothetical protein